MKKEKEPEKHGEYRKLCIINHVQHEVYIEIVKVSKLEKYGGNEEAYIEDMYGFPHQYLQEGLVTWEWFIDITVYGELRDESTTTLKDINEL